MIKGRWTINYFEENTASELIIEESFGKENIDELKERGHSIKVVNALQGSFGPISAIYREENKNWVGIPDPRVETANAWIE